MGLREIAKLLNKSIAYVATICKKIKGSNNSQILSQSQEADKPSMFNKFKLKKGQHFTEE